MPARQRRTFTDHAAKLPIELWQERILPHLKDEKDVSSVNQTNRELYAATAGPLSDLKNTRLERYEAERKRILETFAHPLEPGSQIKFIVDGEEATRTGTVVQDRKEALSDIHHVRVALQGGSEIRFQFGIRDDLQTVFPYDLLNDDDDDESEPEAFATIVNDDLLQAQHNCNKLKHDLVGPKLAKFSKKLSAGASVTLTFLKGGEQQKLSFNVVQDEMYTYCDF